MSKIRKTLRVVTLAAGVGLAAWGVRYATAPAYDGAAGVSYGKVFAPERAQNVKFHMWYPTEGGGRDVTVGGNGVFFGTGAGKNAPPRAGKFPLILISHGSGGNAGQFGWIASKLAAAGYVVVLPNHPGTTTGDASAEAAMRLWERPKDVSAVIDAIIATPEDFPQIDTSRIGVLGFSAGGYTAMALGGVQLDPTQLNSFCDDGKTGMSDCEYFKLRGIDLHKVDFGPAAQPLLDERVKTAVVIDPGTVSAMTEQSLRAAETPMLIVNLGDEGTVPRGVNAVEAAKLLPNAEFQRVVGAWHFSFLAECKPKGAAILENEGELDALCDEVSERSRSDIHEELMERILPYLEAQL